MENYHIHPIGHPHSHKPLFTEKKIALPLLTFNAGKVKFPPQHSISVIKLSESIIKSAKYMFLKLITGSLSNSSFILLYSCHTMVKNSGKSACKHHKMA